MKKIEEAVAQKRRMKGGMPLQKNHFVLTVLLIMTVIFIIFYFFLKNKAH